MKDNNDGGYRVIETSVIPEVRTVRFYDDTLEKVKDGHPEVPIELPSINHAVDKAITHPTHVVKSYNNSYIYVDFTSTNKSGDPLRVPVRIVDGNSARVKTVYFASTEPEGENIVWRGSDDEK